MNKQRRKSIYDIIVYLEISNDKLQKIILEEEEYYDNIPENLQSSERAMESEECQDIINEALEEISSGIETLKEVYNKIQNSIDLLGDV